MKLDIPKVKFECDKKVIDADKYISKIERTITKLEDENKYDEDRIKFFSKHKMIDLVNGKVIHGYPTIHRPCDTPEEMEFEKGLMVRGWKSGLVRRRRQIKKVKLYLDWLYTNKSHIEKIYFTHATIKFIFKTILKTNYFDRMWVGKRLLPDYLDLKLDKDNLKGKHYEASLRYIRKYIYKD